MDPRYGKLLITWDRRIEWKIGQAFWPRTRKSNTYCLHSVDPGAAGRAGEFHEEREPDSEGTVRPLFSAGFFKCKSTVAQRPYYGTTCGNLSNSELHALSLFRASHNTLIRRTRASIFGTTHLQLSMILELILIRDKVDLSYCYTIPRFRAIVKLKGRADPSSLNSISREEIKKKEYPLIEFFSKNPLYLKERFGGLL